MPPLRFALVFGVAISAWSEPIVLRIPPSSPFQTGGSFGHPGAGLSVFGQTFTMPAGTATLRDSLFSIGNAQGWPLDVRAYVMSWEGTKAGNTPLFESDVFTISSVSVGAFVLQPIEVNTHQLPLLAGNSYVAFLFALGAGFYPARSHRLVAEHIGSLFGWRLGHF